MFCRNRAYVAVTSPVILMWVVAAAARAETDAQLLSKIRSTWQARRDGINSFYYVCTVEQIKKIVRERVDAFGEADPNYPPHDEILRTTLTLASHNGKLAYQLEGEQWSHITEAKAPYRFRVAFDGRGNRWLLQGRAPHGRIDYLPEPDSQLTTNVNLKALWLTIDAKAYLKRIGFDTDKMTILRQDALHDDRECIALDVPRSNADWQGRLYVDPAQGFLPIAFVVNYQSDLRYELELEHRHNDRIGWVLAGWTYKQFDRPGELHSTVNGAVMKCEINTALDHELFDVMFPVGTQVEEKVGEKTRYFIQMEDGSLKPIPQEELGRLPKRT